MNAHNFRSPFRRRHAVPLILALSFSLVALCGLSYSTAQEAEKEEREVVDKIPKHLPIKVKVKKPEKLKDLENEDWADDAEVEITNTGTKPIYFLSIRLDMPDVRHENGLMYAFFYNFGRVSLGDLGQPLQPDDVPLRPGETVTLKVPAPNIEGWKFLRGKGEAANPKKIEFIFSVLNFGDGTGFASSTGRPMPIKRERSMNAPPTGGGIGNVARNADTANPPPKTSADSACAPNPIRPPVSFLPAVFSIGAIVPEPEPARDICYQTSRIDCSWIKLGEQTCCGMNIDARDAVLPSLRLWRDANHDGVSQAGELRGLAASDVARLHLDYKESKRVDEFGNRFRYRAKVDDARGAKAGRWAWEVFLIPGR